MKGIQIICFDTKHDLVACKDTGLAHRRNVSAAKLFIVHIIFQEQKMLILAIIVKRPNLTH